MTLQGTLIVNFIGLVLLLWVLNLVRRGRLYVGYGVIFVVAILGSVVLLSVPWLLAAVTHLIGAVFPVSALTLLALCFIVLMLLYILTQITIVSNRLAQLVQGAVELLHALRGDQHLVTRGGMDGIRPLQALEGARFPPAFASVLHAQVLRGLEHEPGQGLERLDAPLAQGREHPLKRLLRDVLPGGPVAQPPRREQGHAPEESLADLRGVGV